MMSSTNKLPKIEIKNEYTHRTATKEGNCFVCSKPSTAVLTNGMDWFYVCVNHLTDVSFCRPIEEPSSSVSATSTTTAKTSSVSTNKTTKEDNTPAAKDKTNNSKEDTSKDETPKDTAKPKDTDQKAKEEPKQQQQPQPQPKKPTKYTLTSSFLYLRERHHRTKAEKERASQVLSNLEFPSVPRGLPSS